MHLVITIIIIIITSIIIIIIIIIIMHLVMTSPSLPSSSLSILWYLKYD